MTFILFGSVQIIQMQQTWFSKCTALFSPCPSVSEEFLGFRCGFRSYWKRTDCVLAHCHHSSHNLSVQSFVMLSCTGQVLRRTPFIKLMFFSLLDTDTLQALLYYKVFHHVKALCQIRICKKKKRIFMTVWYFLWIQLSLGRWKPFLTGCGESYAMLHPL